MLKNNYSFLKGGKDYYHYYKNFHNGLENDTSYDNTLEIASYLRKINVPYDVVNKMMTAMASQISILTIDKLERSGFFILDSINTCGK